MAVLLILAGLALWWLWPREKAAARRLLGVSRSASAAEIEAAFRAALFKAHPDHGGSSEQTRRLTRARDLLLASVTKPRQ